MRSTLRFGAALLLLLCLTLSRTDALELKISHVLPTNETVHEMLLEMGKSLEAKSNGYFKVNVYANSELGNNKDNLEQIRRGANIVGILDSGFLADYVPAYGAMNGPFLFNDYKELARLNKSEWNKGLMREIAARGVKVLTLDWYFGRRSVISGKVIKEPADMVGMKVRVPPNKVWIETVTAMGGSPTVLQWAEVYSALSQKVIDAAEAPLSTIYGSKLHEIHKNISLTNHFTAHVGLVMSQKIWDSIPADMQSLLQAETDFWGVKCSDLTAVREDEWKKKLEAEGVVFNEVDSAAFSKACSVVYDNPAWPAFDELRKEIDGSPYPY